MSSVLFIDSRVADIGALTRDLDACTRVVLLKAGEDGPAQIARALEHERGLEAVHLVLHGAPCQLLLGAGTLQAPDIGRYEAELAAIGASLAASGALLLYGCEVAKGGEGRAFIEALSRAVGAHVAASAKPVGSAALGGGWELEARTGSVAAGVFLGNAAQSAYAHTLPVSNIDLSSLNGTNGFRLSGVAAGDNAGLSVSNAGDVNGDGFDDLIVGAYRADPNGIDRSGASYVVFGKASGFASNLNLSSLNGANGFRLSGVTAIDYAGISVSSAGDVNGDGFADLIIGAVGADQNGNFSGASYVVFGKASGFASNLNLASLDGTNGFRLSGVAAEDRSGRSVSDAGDVNGDGFDDLIVGAYLADPNGNLSSGASYVVFGQASGFASNLNLSSLDGTNGFRLSGAAAGDSSGRTVSAAGDVNGDGFDDLVVGAPGAAGGAGASYVVFGKASGFASDLNLSSLDGTDGFRLSGAAANDFSGLSVSGAGDVNGDGFADLIVGAIGANSFSGASYVVFGQASGFDPNLNLSALDGTNGFRLSGAATEDRSGRFVGGAGDVNGDGFDDLIVGAYGADPNGNSYSGASYVVFGRASGFASDLNLSSLDGTNGFRLSGVAVNDRSGRSVSAAGDVNGDGFDDLIVGALFADPNGSDSGASYVIYGSDFNGAVTHPGGAGADSLVGTAGADALVGGLGNDTLLGGDGKDALRGGAGDDWLDGEAGADRMVGGSGNDTYVVDSLADRVEEDSAGGVDTVRTSVAFSLEHRHELENLTLLGSDDLNALGNAKDNVLSGNAGNNLLDGGLGTDTASYTDAASAVSVNLGVASAQNTIGAGTDTLISIENLTGSGFSDTLTGNSGNNVLNGGAGADTMLGGAGNDTYVLDDAGDVVTEGLDEGADTVQAGISYTLGANVENLTLTGTGNINGTGNGLANVLTGNSGNNVLDGSAGADSIDGGAGSDSIVYDAADTQVNGGADTDTLLVNGSLVALDLTLIPDTVLVNLEQIDITGSGDNALIVTASDVLALSGTSDTLLVKGNAGDAVTVTDDWIAAGTTTISSILYNVYTSGGATLQVQSGVTFSDLNHAPAGADATLATNEDTQLVVTAANFGYNDFDGDAFASVKITALESAGALKLNGADVALDDVITKADIDAGLLTFDPAANAYGAAYATFGFKVSDGTVFSTAANAITVNVGAVNDAPTGGVSINGTPTENQILTAVSTLADVDGLGTLHYQWKANGTNVGADQSTYTLGDADVGKAITVVASYTDGQGFAESAASAPTGTVTAVNDPPTGGVSINGTPTENQILTAVSTLADVDGLGTLHYQWKANGTNVGADQSTYTLGDADVGKAITVVASYTDGQGFAESAASAPTGTVTAVNDPHTGGVSINGTPTENQILTAVSTLADVDGLGTLHYQWKANGTNVGADQSTYTLGDADVGKAITVVASYTDGQGFAESAASAPTGTVTAVNDPHTGGVSINGTPTENQILTAVSTLADVDGLGTLHYQWKANGTNVGADQSTYTLGDADVGKAITVVASYTDGQGFAESAASAPTGTVTAVNDPPTGGVSINGTPTENQILTAVSTLADVDGLGTLHYQWKANGTNVGADQSTYTLGDADVGKAITVVASYTDGQGFAESAASAPTGTVTAVNDPPTGGVSINGTPTENQILTAVSTLADVDGLGTLHYQWKANGTNVGADQSTYTLGDADVGKAITVVASYTDGQGFAESAASAPTGTVTAVNDPHTGGVSINGTPTENQILTAVSTLADVDGLGTLHYQWKANGTNVGADQSTYTLGDADVGKAITVVASYTDGQGFAESAASAPTGTVTAVNDPHTGGVSINGTPTENQILTAVSTLADVDGLGTLHYQWKANGTNVGADQSTYTLGDADVGKAITVVASYTDGQGFAESAASAPTGTVTAVNDPPTGGVSINGTPTENQILTAVSTLADVDGLGTLHYQWKANGTNVGADQSTYTLGDADVGKAITVVASYTDGQGFAESAASAPTAPVGTTQSGTSGDDTLVGTANADTLAGLGGNDTLRGLGGNDALDGGAGFDTAVQAGLYRQYLETGNTIGSGTVQGPQGTDTLSGMERLQFVDGSLTFDPGANIAKVVRLYLATLERLPDAQGLNFWLGQLDTGTGLNVMADSFVASSEFQAKYGALSNGQFVNLVYQNVLHRNADAGGLAFWTGQLDAGLTRGQVVTGFSESAEMTTINAALFNAGLWDIDETAGSVARLYLGGLGHAPTLAQVPSLVSDIAALKGGTLNLLQEANTLTGSTEFVSAYGSLNNTDFVNQLYQNLLGRAGSAGELTSNLNLLNTGHTRGEVLLGLTESAEYQGKTIGQIDQGFAIDNGLQGTAGNDTIVGTVMSEVLKGLGGNDALSGGAGNDTLLGGPGNDSLNGGAGFDVAQYAGAFRQYLATGNAISAGTVQGPEGTDTLTGIEQLSFVDGSLTFDPSSHIAQVTRLYLATLNRLPDALGQNFWQGILDTGVGQVGLNTMAGNFVASAEFQSHYGALTNGQFVDQLYQNVLHRPADAGGLAFWTSALGAGATRGQVVVQFSESAEMTTINAALFNAGLWDIDEAAASVARLYFGALGHAPTVANLVSDVAAVKAGTLTLIQDANALTLSTEFTTAYGGLSGAAYANQLYQNLLARPASTSEQAYAASHTKSEVLLALTESQPYQLKLIGQIDHGIAASDAHFP